MRRVTSNLFTPVQLAKQDELHQFNLERLAVLKSEKGLTDEFIVGKDEVGVFLFLQEKERWEKKGTKNVTSAGAADKRQYTGDIVTNALGEMLFHQQIFSGNVLCEGWCVHIFSNPLI